MNQAAGSPLTREQSGFEKDADEGAGAYRWRKRGAVTAEGRAEGGYLDLDRSRSAVESGRRKD